MKEIDLVDRPQLERLLAAGIKSCIHDHGPITKELIGSATKRIIFAIRAHNKYIRDIHELREDLCQNDSIGG